MILTDAVPVVSITRKPRASGDDPEGVLKISPSEK